MIICQSEMLDVQLQVFKDAKGNDKYLSDYGLQRHVFDDLEHALADFNENVNHAIRCEGMLE